MSANGARKGGTPYQHTKALAEAHLVASGLDYTIFRPSVVFGDPHGTMEIATQLCRDMIRVPLPAVGFHNGLVPGKDAEQDRPLSLLETLDQLGDVRGIVLAEALARKLGQLPRPSPRVGARIERTPRQAPPPG